MPVSREWTFQRSVMRKVYNLEVADYFRDIFEADLEDINVPRKALFRACWIRKNETQSMAQIKREFFRYDVQRIQNRPDVCGMPKEEVDMLFKYKPFIYFYFKQDPEAVPDDFEPIEMELKIRLVKESSTSITETELKLLATKIKQEFGQGNGFAVSKGANKYTYEDLEHGLKNSVNALNQSEAVSVFQKLCSIVNATYDADKVKPYASSKPSDNTPGTQMILGKSRKKKRYRPTGTVRFRYAKALIHGLSNTQYLVDLSGRHPNAYEFL